MDIGLIVSNGVGYWNHAGCLRR